MTILLGIDPGSRFTGYGVVKVTGNHYQYIDSGVIRIAATSVAAKLHTIYQGIQAVVLQHLPQEVAIEDVFLQNNFKAALKLGQARGAAIVAVANHGLNVAEYSARTIKQSVVGYGAASKDQVQHMVKRLLNIKDVLEEDAADGLAVAICHGQNRVLNRVYAELAQEAEVK